MIQIGTRLRVSHRNVISLIRIAVAVAVSLGGINLTSKLLQTELSSGQRQLTSPTEPQTIYKCAASESGILPATPSEPSGNEVATTVCPRITRPKSSAKVLALAKTCHTSSDLLRKLGPPDTKNMLEGSAPKKECWDYSGKIRKGNGILKSHCIIITVRCDTGAIVKEPEDLIFSYGSASQVVLNWNSNSNRRDSTTVEPVGTEVRGDHNTESQQDQLEKRHIRRNVAIVVTEDLQKSTG